MTRALQAMLSKYYAEDDVPNGKRISKDDLAVIVETSNGDIRSAIMALQFACGMNASTRHGKRKRGGGSTRAL